MFLGEIGEFVHQIAEGSERFRGASRYAVDLFEVLDAVEEGGAVRVRVSCDQAFGPCAETAFRHVEDAAHVHVVRGVDDGLQVCERVLDFLAFVEFGAADQLVWQVGVDHRLFQGA